MSDDEQLYTIVYEEDAERYLEGLELDPDEVEATMRYTIKGRANSLEQALERARTKETESRKLVGIMPTEILEDL